MMSLSGNGVCYRRLEELIIVSATTTVQFSMDAEQKEAVETLLESMGISLNTAYDLFIQQCLNCYGLPFPVMGSRNEEIISSKSQVYEERMAALERLNSLCRQVPADFDYDKELAEARDASFESAFGH